MTAFRARRVGGGTDLTYDFRMATARERRLFPRVDVSAPIFARPLARNPHLARGDAIGGALLNASRGGVAFVCPEAVSPGDLVELAVRTGDEVPRSWSATAASSRATGAPRETVVRCSFVEPTRDMTWIDALLGEIDPAPAAAG